MSDTDAHNGNRPVEAVVFDLDGTLIDSAAQIAAAINIVLRANGLETFTSEEIATHIGWGSRKLIETTFAARGRWLADDEAGRFERIYLSNYADLAPRTSVFYPGAIDLVAALQGAGVILGICTNKPAAISAAIFETAGISGRFSVVVGGDSGFGLKPEPGPLAAARRQLRTTAPRTLFVGDSVIDAQAANGAGIPFVHVRHPRHAPLEATHPVHYRIDGLPPLLDLVLQSRRGAA